MSDPKVTMLLSEIARKLRKLDCICEGVNSESSLVVEDYQPLDCNGDPVGSPLIVMPVITVAKQDVSLCNYEQVATAIADAINNNAGDNYDVPGMYIVPESTTISLVNDLGIDVTKLHSVGISIIPGTSNTGTVDVSGSLGGGSQSVTLLPVGVNTGWQASTVWGTGDISFTTTADARVLITTTSKA